jgi:hypothetical protein
MSTIDLHAIGELLSLHQRRPRHMLSGNLHSPEKARFCGLFRQDLCTALAGAEPEFVLSGRIFSKPLHWGHLVQRFKYLQSQLIFSR